MTTTTEARSEPHSDRELLEMAARAAGCIVDLAGVAQPYAAGQIRKALNGNLYFAKANGDFSDWRPLSDDGDALRLAVKFGLAVMTRAQFTAEDQLVIVRRAADVDIEQELNGDPDAATRRAIVRAAAALAPPSVHLAVAPESVPKMPGGS